MPTIERCHLCDDPTGKAGAGDGSLYDCAGIGPYCNLCFPNKLDAMCESSSHDAHYLQAIVDKLPKTADGVVIVPGMKLWYCFGFENRQIHSMAALFETDVASAYSTIEAAEAAAKDGANA